MKDNTLSKDRLAQVDAAIKAETYATVDVQRGYGGQVATRWTGDEALPIKVTSEMKGEIAVLCPELVFVRDLDEKTSVYARP